MSGSVTVQTGARLHFGFLACKPQSGREFGGAGLMIDSPGFDLTVRESDRFRYEGPSTWSERVETLARRLLDETADDDVSKSAPPCGHDDIGRRPSSVEVEIREEIPPHVGLGSGTQLAMALAVAVARLRGQSKVGPEILGRPAGRGERSALGIHGFLHGGFIGDGGKLPGENVGALSARTDFPVHWRMLLVTPGANPGLAGAGERAAFERLPPMSPETTIRLCAILVNSMLPSVESADFARFGESLFEYGRIVGEYFAPVQGGTYADRSMSDLVAYLRKNGVHGVGQTSWGPTIFALCPSQNEAEECLRDIRAQGKWAECRFQVTGARNTGADVRVETG
jgi:beta-RFAP synthase